MIRSGEMKSEGEEKEKKRETKNNEPTGDFFINKITKNKKNEKKDNWQIENKKAEVNTLIMLRKIKVANIIKLTLLIFT